MFQSRCMEEKKRIFRKVESILKENPNRSSYIGEDDFVSLVKGGMSINFHIKYHALDIENIFRTVKRSLKIIKDKFDYTIDEIEISIYASKEELRKEGRSKSRYASWIAGIYDGKIRLISESVEEEPEALYIILTHEIIHLAVHRMSQGKCPYWLDEGLAVYLSQELSDEYVDNLYKAVKKDRIIPLETLDNISLLNNSEEFRQLAYAESFSITEYLIETHGWEGVKSIIFQSLRRPIKAILGDFSINYYLIEQGWKRWLMRKSA
jgi:hypothetical protein